jgi:hypothetical protein
MKRHAQFRDKLADIILEHTQELIVFTSMTSIKDHGTRKAYQDAILRAFYDATKFRMRGKDSLYIVLARHPEFSPWSILRRFEQIDWQQKLAGCGIFQPDDVLPLQAAARAVAQDHRGTKEKAVKDTRGDPASSGAATYRARGFGTKRCRSHRDGFRWRWLLTLRLRSAFRAKVEIKTAR